MKLYRFLDEHNRLAWGTHYDGKTAQLIKREEKEPPADAGKRVEVKILLAPLEPRAILCIGLNYKEHAAETGSALPERPMLFMKNPAALQHPDQPIVLPPETISEPEVDYECELAVVIGRNCKNVKEENALENVMGYTIGNDVSARIWQKKRAGGQFVRGKSFDTFCPLGPCLVTPDEITDPQDLKLSTKLNGQTLQDGHTSDMIFTVARLIAELSHETTLLAGTVILTGTPSGVGVARDPQVFLKPGDEISMSIEGIGELNNHVISADAIEAISS